MKLWHDDIRRPPDDSWIWARTNDEAKTIIAWVQPEEISLDHDLGLHEFDPDEVDADLRVAPANWLGREFEDGMELVRWMCETENIPPIVRIHSWNPVGAENMRRLLADHDCKAAVEPYSPT